MTAGGGAGRRGQRAGLPRGAVRWALVVWVALMAVGAATLLPHLLSHGSHPAARPRATPDKISQAQVALRPEVGTVPAKTQLATVRSETRAYSSPGHPLSYQVPATWYYRPSVLPVIGQRPGWVQVRLAQRPNGSTAWLPASDVTLSSTSYQIVVSNAAARLSLYNHGQLVFTAPAGVGTSDDPTPDGEYFVAFDEQPPPDDPGYGPFIMVTSAHSPNILDWQGSGDAIIGIHGPLGEDKQIGTTGARISHGCIRLHDDTLRKLAAVPPGTPIRVIG